MNASEEINSSDSDATISYDAENSQPPGDIENQPPDATSTENTNDSGFSPVGAPSAQIVNSEPINDGSIVEVPLQAVEQVILGSQNSISSRNSTQSDVIIKPISSKKRKR